MDRAERKRLVEDEGVEGEDDEGVKKRLERLEDVMRRTRGQKIMCELETVREWLLEVV
jgi:hypothetical protein